MRYRRKFLEVVWECFGGAAWVIDGDGGVAECYE